MFNGAQLIQASNDIRPKMQTHPRKMWDRLYHHHTGDCLYKDVHPQGRSLLARIQDWLSLH